MVTSDKTHYVPPTIPAVQQPAQDPHVCPYCGRCPVCGSPQPAPEYPYPYPYSYPIWIVSPYDGFGWY